MNLKDKNKYKLYFKKELGELEKYVFTDNGDWTVKGFIDVYKNIYTIFSDNKIVSKILEIHIFSANLGVCIQHWLQNHFCRKTKLVF
jgi:hypothetical protein